MKEITLRLKRDGHIYKLSGFDWSRKEGLEAKAIMEKTGRKVILVPFPTGSVYRGSKEPKYTDAPLVAIYYR
jgi:hypothetical protein